MCGENQGIGDLDGGLSGSSPRVRGKHTAGALDLAGKGLIPACAGKTSVSSRGELPNWAHPRVCGENRGFI